MASQKPSEETLGGGNDVPSIMWTKDWSLDLAIGEVTSCIDKCYFRARIGEKIQLGKVQMRMKKRGG